MSRVLEQEARKSLSLNSGKVREPRQLYAAERMSILKQLNLHDDMATVATQVERSKHLGAFARNGRKTNPPPSNGRAVAIQNFNAGRDAEFGDNLARLSKDIGDHLARDGHVPAFVWTEFEGLNNNRRFFRKTEEDLTSSTRNVVGPGCYETNNMKLPPGGKISGGNAPVRWRNDAQLEATDRMKHKESVFRTSKDYGKQEQGHLERLYEELGRPRFSYKRGDSNYEEHLEKYAYRHIQIYHRRNLDDVKVGIFRAHVNQINGHT